MNKSKHSKSSSDSENKEGESRLDRSREKEIETQPYVNKNIIQISDDSKSDSSNDINTELVNFNNSNFISMKTSLEDCIKLFDNENARILKKDNSYKKIIDDVKLNMSITPNEKQDTYSKKVIQIIKNMKKSTKKTEFPKLPYGSQLTDDEFINLLQECASYANYIFNTIDIENIKNKILNDCLPALQNMFKRGQIFKDIIENSLLTLLTVENKKDQEDSFNILNTEYTTATPIIDMNFNDNIQYKLNTGEFIDVFCSYIYIQNYKKTLNKFIPKFEKKVPSDKKLKQYIREYFNSHFIYFCTLPKNICAITIHTGNIYIRTEYLFQYYNEKNPDSQLVIREKILLDVGHELTHALLREISEDMRSNFFLKSAHNDATKDSEIQFRDKFTDEIHSFDMNESGNVLDFNLFNCYYFGDIFPNEAKLFLNIKKMTSIKEFKQKLNNIIYEEKTIGMVSSQVNKFKKMKNEHVRRCIRSRILRTIKVNKDIIKKKFFKYDNFSD